MLTQEEMQNQHRRAVEATRDRLQWILNEVPKKKMTVGKHEARNYAHLKQVLAEADETCPRAADTIRWIIWREALEAQRMAEMANFAHNLGQPRKAPSAIDALQVIADLPRTQSEDRENGQEDAYRAVENLFDEPPYIAVSEPGNESQVSSPGDTAWTLFNEIDAAERRLKHFCNLVNAGEAQGGGREFFRQIAYAFEGLREKAGMAEFRMHPDEDDMNVERVQMNEQEPEILHQDAAISWDPEVHAYYIAPQNRPEPPFTKQVFVQAIIDVGADGTLAGIEIIDEKMPQPHVPENEPETANDILEKCLRVAIEAKHEDAPFGMDKEEADLWHQARVSSYQHALELIGDKKIPLPTKPKK